MFNFDKQIGSEKDIFFGSGNGLHDTIVVQHPRLEELYLKQRATDWMHNEFDLARDREQLRSCPKGVRDLTLYNILFQWHLDSLAADNLFPIFAPFLSNSEANALFCLNDAMEYTHSKTYVEIVRQCLPDKEEFDEFIADIEKVRERLSPAFTTLTKLKELGAKYTLGLANKDDCYATLLKSLVTWWCMERIQFMASFPMTFAVVDMGYIQGIGNYVQKIMLDEYNIHAETMKYVILHELSTEKGKEVWKEIENECIAIVDLFVQAEKDWAAFSLSEGRGADGLSTMLLNAFIDYSADDIYTTLFTHKRKVIDNPLPFMDTWLNPDKTQTALQEVATGNYLLNSVKEDLGEQGTVILV